MLLKIKKTVVLALVVIILVSTVYTDKVQATSVVVGGAIAGTDYIIGLIITGLLTAGVVCGIDDTTSYPTIEDKTAAQVENYKGYIKELYTSGALDTVGSTSLNNAILSTFDTSVDGTSALNNLADEMQLDSTDFRLLPGGVNNNGKGCGIAISGMFLSKFAQMMKTATDYWLDTHDISDFGTSFVVKFDVTKWVQGAGTMRCYGSFDSSTSTKLKKYQKLCVYDYSYFSGEVKGHQFDIYGLTFSNKIEGGIVISYFDYDLSDVHNYYLNNRTGLWNLTTSNLSYFGGYLETFDSVKNTYDIGGIPTFNSVNECNNYLDPDNIHRNENHVIPIQAIQGNAAILSLVPDNMIINIPTADKVTEIITPHVPEFTPYNNPEVTPEPEPDPDPTENPTESPTDNPNTDPITNPVPGIVGDIITEIDNEGDKNTDEDNRPEDKPENEPSVNPSYDYEMPTGIVSKFPFCIPYDLISLITCLQADREAPKFSFPFQVRALGFDTSIDVDLSKYNDVARVVRWAETLGFIAFLMLKTRDLMKG